MKDTTKAIVYFVVIQLAVVSATVACFMTGHWVIGSLGVVL